MRGNSVHSEKLACLLASHQGFSQDSFVVVSIMGVFHKTLPQPTKYDDVLFQQRPTKYIHTLRRLA